uniref:Ras-associating domain-containing protein n=1 Tax=Glossina brevipalpis TaxID=37001 RepID=A0A1A9X274_9MUSC
MYNGLMLKHVQISPLRKRSDSVSLRSNNSCASSMSGNAEVAADLPRTPSRSSSYLCLSDYLPQAIIKVFTSCLNIDIEYKTLRIQWHTSSKEIIMQLLRRERYNSESIRHHYSGSFYLSMEVSVRRPCVTTILVLDDDTRPTIFYLQLKSDSLTRTCSYFRVAAFSI